MSRTLRWVLSLALALGAHGALALGSDAEPKEKAPRSSPSSSSPPPPPPAPELPPEPKPVDETEPSTLARPNTNAKASPAARAGNVLTARSDAPAPSDSEPVDFVTDPNGTSYAGGVVARGGSGDHGATGTAAGKTGARARATATRTTSKGDAVPAPNLLRKASLKSGTQCSGYYPGHADSDSAVVTLVANIGPDGAVTRLVVAGETPAGQGFGAAARACIGTGRFEPALDEAGRPVASAVSVRVRFTR